LNWEGSATNFDGRPEVPMQIDKQEVVDCADPNRL